MKTPSRRIVGAVVLAAALAFPLGVVASHRFSDVPDSNTFHADIDAIADVGVTVGCSATEYCPKEFVTREQMAAFLNRLGALAPGKTPVVNADKVDGYDAASLARVAFNSVEDAPDGSGAKASATITAPARGWFVMSGTLDLFNAQTAESNVCWLTKDGTLIPNSDVAVSLGPTHPMDECHVQAVAKTCGGTSTIDVQLGAGDEDYTDVVRASIQVMYTPFNGTGAAPSVLTCSGPVDGGESGEHAEPLR